MAKEQLYGPEVIAKLFDFEGVRRVDQLVQDGVLTPTIVKENGRRVRKYDLIPTVQSYIRFLKDRADRRAQGTPEEAAKQAEADLRYKEARAEKMELEIQELRGQMHRAEDVAVLTNDMIAKLRGGIMAIPGQVAVDCADARTPTEAAAVVKKAVDDFLNETATYKYTEADYRRLVREREKWVAEIEEMDSEELSDSSSDFEEDSGLRRT